MKDVAAGALAGCVATFPMTVAMEALHRRLPQGERYPLPPRQITERIVAQASVRPYLDRDDRLALSLLSHFAYGSAAGVAYTALVRGAVVRGPLAGAAFGAGVWAASYLGLLPALGILNPATRHPPRRTGVMIAAHLVWGLALGGLTEILLPRPKRTSEVP
jgi:hypothetical protein